MNRPVPTKSRVILGSALTTLGHYLIVISLGIMAVAVLNYWILEKRSEHRIAEEPPPTVTHGEWGTLNRRILDAKAEGRKQFQLRSINCGWDIGSLNEALARDTIILAQVVGKKTYAGKYDLTTWYKFRIIETLSERPMPEYLWSASWADPPQEVRPLQDEFVIAERNGVLEIDGVLVVQDSNSPVYSIGNSYLLFLHVESSTRLAARAGTDPRGVFNVDESGNLRAYVDSPYPLREQMEARFGNSITNLRSALKN